MDRERYKKVVTYFIIWLFFAIILTMGMKIYAIQERRINHIQREEMTVMHPEQEQEIKDSFDYYATKRKNIIFLFWIILLGVSVVLFCLLYGIQLGMECKKRAGNRNHLRLLSEQLEQYRNGNFQRIPSSVTVEECSHKGEEWGEIQDSLQELGYYFALLKEQLNREENNTKSLIADISHQLKTPLSSLRMSHELAQEVALTDEERQEFLSKEEQEIHKLEILLEELVNLSRLENHMIQIKPELSSLKKSITEAVNQVFMKALNKNIKLQVDMEDDSYVYHDTKWTVEAISNVLDNAIKYSNENTGVSINVHPLPNLIVVEIEDEGMGVPKEELHKIFHRFYRGKNASDKVKEGAGIGLYLARRILEEQGGTIVAKRKQPFGTVFRITFPI